MRKMFKYTPLYANGKEPVIEEQDVYRIEIPYVPTLPGSEINSTQKTAQKTAQKTGVTCITVWINQRSWAVWTSWL